MGKVIKFYNKIAFCIVCGWAIFEILLCAIVLFSPRKNYTSNFLYQLCEEKDCDNFITKALIGRIITSAVMLVGSVLVLLVFFLFLYKTYNKLKLVMFNSPQFTHSSNIYLLKINSFNEFSGLEYFNSAMVFSQCNWNISSSANNYIFLLHM